MRITAVFLVAILVVSVGGLASADPTIWDTGTRVTEKHYGLVAWDYRDSWVEVAKGTTGFVSNDLVLEGSSFYISLHGSNYDANFGYMKGGSIGKPDELDAPSRKNEMYRSYDTPGGYRAYGEGSQTHEIIINTENEIVVRSHSYPCHKGDGDWVVTTDYRILKGRKWVEIIPVHQASEQGFHGESKIIVVPDGNGPGNDYVADAYDYANGGTGQVYFAEGKMFLDFFMEGDGIWLMTWPTPSAAKPRGIWQYDGWPCGWDYVDGEPDGILPNIWSSPFAHFGSNGNESIFVGFLNGQWTHAYWNYQNIKQSLSAGTKLSNWQITFSRSPKYHDDWKPVYPAVYRLIGKIGGNFYTQQVNVMNTSDPVEFTMPVAGTLDYVLIYMYDRNSSTPSDVSTPMDIYRETISADTTPPVVMLKKIKVNGSVDDDTVTDVDINGVSVSVASGTYSHEVDVTSTNTITITAVNGDGKTVTRTIEIK
jgi:hypothetical protein